jgi:N utilization substance protein A
MHIDMAALRALEREKDISFDVVVEAIEAALLSAYHKTPGAHAHARVDLDKRSGDVTVWARERLDADGEPADGPDDLVMSESSESTRLSAEFEDTPEDFGRYAAAIARQLIFQRLRDAEDEQKYGEFSGKVGDIVSGVIQQGSRPGDVMVDLGRIEALMPSAERVPEEKYAHGERIKAYVYEVEKGMRGPRVRVSRTHPSLVKLLFALEAPEIADGTVEIAAIAREAGHRTKIAVRATVAGPVSGSGGGSVSDRMSMRHPVSLAARRAFWPSLPMASDNWKSGTTTRAVRALTSTRVTPFTCAGDSACAMNSAGSSL